MPVFDYSDLFHSWPLLACGLFPMIAVAAAAHMSDYPSTAQKKTVFYARYSSENQREDSIDDQFRNIMTHLDHMEIPYKGAIRLADEAVSGTVTKRDNLQILLEMVKRNEVGLVAVDDFSRLTRAKDYGVLWDEMVARGCRFISALDHIDSYRDGDEINAMFKGLMNNITNKIHGKRARRGIVGRFLDPKGSAGSHPYGYVSRFSDPEAAFKYKGVGPKPKKDLFIDEDQAAIIREVFRLYGEEEWSLSQIARHLNEKGVPTGNRSNRRGKDGVTRYSNGWHKVLIRKMLQQKKYIGDWAWGEYVHVKLDDKRIVRPADPRDVIRVERPDLVIIPMALWDKVQTRLAYFQKRSGYKDGQKRRGRKHHYSEDYPTDLVGGLLFCGKCGSRLHLVPKNSSCATGPYYRCPIATVNGKYKSINACDQRGFVHKTRAIEALCSYLHEYLLDCEGWLESVYTAAKEEYMRRLANMPDEAKNLKNQHKDLVAAIANITKAIETVTNDAPESLVRRLVELDGKKAEIEVEMRRLEANNAETTAFPTMDWVRKQLADLAETFAKDHLKAAKLFREFFGKVKVKIVVAPGKKRGHPELEFRPNANRLLPWSSYIRLPGVSVKDAQLQHTETPVVTLSLAGSDKLDKLMPTIDAMRRDGMEWREICAKLGIARSWTNIYYNRWKKLTSGASSATTPDSDQDNTHFDGEQQIV